MLISNLICRKSRERQPYLYPTPDVVLNTGKVRRHEKKRTYIHAKLQIHKEKDTDAGGKKNKNQTPPMFTQCGERRRTVVETKQNGRMFRAKIKEVMEEEGVSG